MVCTGAWAGIKTSTKENPFPYGLYNVNCGFIANDLSIYHKDDSDQSDKHGLFIFIETGTEKNYKIYELTSGKYFSAKSGFRTSDKNQTELVQNESDATTWVVNLKSNNPDKYTISPSTNTGTFVNFHGGASASENKAGSVGFHTNGNDDEGSFWQLIVGPFLGDPVSSIEANKYYAPYCVGHSSFLSEEVGTNKGRLYLTYNANFATSYYGNKLLPYVWKTVAGNNNGFKFQTVSTNNWIGKVSYGNTNTYTVADNGEEFFPTSISGQQFSVRTTSTYSNSNNQTTYWNGNGNNGASSGTFCVWGTSTPSADSNGAYKFYEIEGMEYYASYLAEVKYGVTITNEDNFEFIHGTYKHVIGAPANNDCAAYSLPAYYSAISTPTVPIVEAEGTKIMGTCTSSLPFTPGKFYAIKLRQTETDASTRGYMTLNGTKITCRNNGGNSKDGENTAFTFRRVAGTPYFTIHNLAKGLNYGVKANEIASGTQEVNLTEEPSLFYPIANTNTSVSATPKIQFMLANSANSYQLGDHGSGSLAIWKEGKSDDAGSCFTIEDVTESLTATVQNTVTEIAPKIGKVGYPTATYSLSDYTTVNSTNYFDAKSAIENAYAATDIVLPEDGKAYFLTNVAADDAKTKHILYESASEKKLKWAPITDIIYTDKQHKGLYICRKTDDRFVFVNAATGNFLIWRGSGAGENSNKGLREVYAEDCRLTVKHAVYSGTYQGKATNQKDFFGYVCIGGTRGTNNSVCFLYSTGGTDNFNQDTTNDVHRYGDGHSAMFAIEEVTDYSVNKTTLKSPKVDDDKTYASIYLPYAVELPQNVKAYKVTETRDASFHLEEISEDGNLPKETGAILVGEDTNMKTLVPCAATPTAQNDNMLSGCKETTLVSSLTGSTGTVYVLNGGQASGIGFFPLSSSASLSPYKAYYCEESTSSVQGYSFNFDEAIVTAIQNISATGSQKSEVYDLQGRRMQHVQKGLNIVNGRKVIR